MQSGSCFKIKVLKLIFSKSIKEFSLPKQETPIDTCTWISNKIQITTKSKQY